MTKFNLMILAAGYGRRMNTLTNKAPKPLLKINDKELLRHNIDFFINLGCENIVINTHYLHDQIKNCIQKYYVNKNIKLIYESILLDTGGGIKNALNFLGGKNFLVTNADILWKENNIKDVLNFIENYQDIQTCKLFLANSNNFNGLKKNTADFNLNNSFVTRWKKNDPYLYYTGLQIINSKVFNLVEEKIFSLNKLWDLLISKHNIEGQISNSSIIHIGDINAFNRYKD